jgi:hypothetical protein
MFAELPSSFAQSCGWHAWTVLWTDYIIPISRDLPFCAWVQVQTAGHAQTRREVDVSLAAVLFEVKRTLVDGK